MSATTSVRSGDLRAGTISALVLAGALIWKVCYVTKTVPASGAIQLIMLGVLMWSSRAIFRGHDGRMSLPLLSMGMFALGGIGIILLSMLGSGAVKSNDDAISSSVGFVLASALIMLAGWTGLAVGCLRHARNGGREQWQVIGIFYFIGIGFLVTAMCLVLVVGASHEALSYVGRLIGTLSAALGVGGAMFLIIGLLVHAWASSFGCRS